VTCVKEYQSPWRFRRDAKKMARAGWRVTSQSQTRGWLTGVTKLITVSYERDER
jgi:hypothetical protein